MGSVLLTDLYQLTMLQAYFDRGMSDTAVFELFIRRLPPERNFLVAAGLEQALDYLETVTFTDQDIEHLQETSLFKPDFLEQLREFQFTGDVDAVPEGTVFFADEPVLRVVAPLPEAQIVESRLLNILHFQTLIASKAARCVLSAPGRQLVDFGMRRAHGSEAAIYAARASYLAGFAGTATVLAKPLFGIPIFGTMAHSFVQAHDSELEAFEHFARSHQGPIVLLIDTYDTEDGARRTVQLADRLAREDIHIRAVRLDSGDLSLLSKNVRRILDEGGHPEIRIFASSSINEYKLEQLVRDGAPIDGFGIGTHLDVSEDAPSLDCVYKIQEYAGQARRKRSSGKATWPGRKQVFRQTDASGQLVRDVLTVVGDVQPGDALIQPVMRGGKRVGEPSTLAALRDRASAELARLTPDLRDLSEPAACPVHVASALEALAREVDARYP